MRPGADILVFSNSRGKKHYKGTLVPKKLDNIVDSEPNDRNRYSKRKDLFLISGFHNIKCVETYRLKFQ